MENVPAFVFNLGYTVVGFTVLLLGSMYLDRRIARMKGGHFKKVIDKIHDSSDATAIYYGLRFVGLCLLVQSFIRI
jgi:hypothetical protein